MGCKLSICFGQERSIHHHAGSKTSISLISMRPRNRTTAPSGPTCNEEEIDLSHFTLSEKIIGLGGFGLVRVATKLSASDIGTSYALKSLNKVAVLQRNSGLNAVLTELKALAVLKDNKYICNVHYAFQDSISLHLILDLAKGGDMRHNLRLTHLKRFSEFTAKFYFCQIVYALECCHSLGILHRDVKPENIVMMETGYIKLTDFGVAKILDDIDDCRSTSGTHGYMAPEIYLPLHKHGRQADWFSLGVTLYEFLIGRRPFETSRLTGFRDNPYNQDKLQLVSLSRFSFMSHECKDFLSCILHAQPEMRIGKRGGIEEIRNHAWLKDYDWEGIWNQTTCPPFIPNTSRHCTELMINYIPEVRSQAGDPSLIPSPLNQTKVLPKEEQALFKNYEYRNHVYKCKGYHAADDDFIMRVGVDNMIHNQYVDDETKDENDQHHHANTYHMNHDQYDSATMHASSAFPYQGKIMQPGLSLSFSFDQSLPTGKHTLTNQHHYKSLSAPIQPNQRDNDHDSMKPPPAIITLKEPYYHTPIRELGRRDQAEHHVDSMSSSSKKRSGYQSHDTSKNRRCDMMSSQSIISSDNDERNSNKFRHNKQTPHVVDNDRERGIFSRDAFGMPGYP